MSTPIEPTRELSRRQPWNKGKLTGPKPPLQPRHVRGIRTLLQLAGQARDLALFNLAIDSKLRACHVVSLRVEDVVHPTAIQLIARWFGRGRPAGRLSS